MSAASSRSVQSSWSISLRRTCQDALFWALLELGMVAHQALQLDLEICQDTTSYGLHSYPCSEAADGFVPVLRKTYYLAAYVRVPLFQPFHDAHPHDFWQLIFWHVRALGWIACALQILLAPWDRRGVVRGLHLLWIRWSLGSVTWSVCVALLLGYNPRTWINRYTHMLGLPCLWVSQVLPLPSVPLELAAQALDFCSQLALLSICYLKQVELPTHPAYTLALAVACSTISAVLTVRTKHTAAPAPVPASRAPAPSDRVSEGKQLPATSATSSACKPGGVGAAVASDSGYVCQVPQQHTAESTLTYRAVHQLPTAQASAVASSARFDDGSRPSSSKACGTALEDKGAKSRCFPSTQQPAVAAPDFQTQQQPQGVPQAAVSTPFDQHSTSVPPESPMLAASVLTEGIHAAEAPIAPLITSTNHTAVASTGDPVVDSGTIDDSTSATTLFSATTAAEGSLVSLGNPVLLLVQLPQQRSSRPQLSLAPYQSVLGARSVLQILHQHLQSQPDSPALDSMRAMQRPVLAASNMPTEPSADAVATVNLLRQSHAGLRRYNLKLKVHGADLSDVKADFVNELQALALTRGLMVVDASVREGCVDLMLRLRQLEPLDSCTPAGLPLAELLSCMSGHTPWHGQRVSVWEDGAAVRRMAWDAHTRSWVEHAAIRAPDQAQARAEAGNMEAMLAARVAASPAASVPSGTASDSTKATAFSPGFATATHTSSATGQAPGCATATSLQGSATANPHGLTTAIPQACATVHFQAAATATPQGCAAAPLQASATAIQQGRGAAFNPQHSLFDPKLHAPFVAGSLAASDSWLPLWYAEPAVLHVPLSNQAACAQLVLHRTASGEAMSSQDAAWAESERLSVVATAHGRVLPVSVSPFAGSDNTIQTGVLPNSMNPDLCDGMTNTGTTANSRALSAASDLSLKSLALSVDSDLPLSECVAAKDNCVRSLTVTVKDITCPALLHLELRPEGTTQRLLRPALVLVLPDESAVMELQRLATAMQTDSKAFVFCQQLLSDLGMYLRFAASQPNVTDTASPLDTRDASGARSLDISSQIHASLQYSACREAFILSGLRVLAEVVQMGLPATARLLLDSFLQQGYSLYSINQAIAALSSGRGLLRLAQASGQPSMVQSMLARGQQCSMTDWRDSLVLGEVTDCNNQVAAHGTADGTADDAVCTVVVGATPQPGARLPMLLACKQNS